MTCRTWHPAEAQLRTSNNPMLRACRKPCRTWHPAEAQLHSCRPDQPPSAACRTWCKTSGQRPCPRRIQSTAQLSSVPVSRSPYRTWPSHSCRTWCRAPSLSASAQGQQRQDWTGSPDGLGGDLSFQERTSAKTKKSEEQQRSKEGVLCWSKLSSGRSCVAPPPHSTSFEAAIVRRPLLEASRRDGLLPGLACTAEKPRSRS